MDAVAFFTVITLILMALYWVGTYKFSLIKSFNIPGSKPWPYVGNLLDIFKYGDMVKLMQEYRRRYGNIFYLCIGQEPVIVVGDPELLKLITVKEFEKFRNRGGLDLPPPNNVAIGAAKDADWKRIRSTLTPTFSSAKIKQMVPIVKQSCQILMEKFRQVADSGMTVDVGPYCEQYALEVLMSSAFGLETNVQKKPNTELVKRVRQLFGDRRRIEYILQCFPFYSHLKTLLVFVTKAGLRMQYFNNMAQGIIDQRKTHGIDTERKDLIYLMMNTTDNEGKRKLTDPEITAQSVVFLAAGLHTTSSTLKNFLQYLAFYPQLQEKLYDEIENASQADPDKPIYDLVMELQYLNCFFNEVLRVLIKAGTQIKRTCSETCTLNGVYFPKGSSVILAYFLAHSEPDAWVEPSKFNPERFCDESSKNRHPYQFNPFGVGPRNCIGMRLAQMEIKITIVQLMREFKFVVGPESKPHHDGTVPLIVELRAK